ncbi:amino acid ABC transporter substrate-binding protein [Mesorhizobium tianshanense]|uniref:Amino acid ABC transporter substrate-binding protein (PAAT family) n=1 Tax=Mesorhizobium tianshanense TaxID=39844 RepID=A0A562N8K1_9HYPH|nr:ABC transporter substrate-binding protein [Mesorhizobium tianshanense]TWI28408.1 amino acid ABC transporter substrate-binding protein (PAAT family) [Mesorhizobium tianshanense]GLS36881.1 amino acid ABC transporter substrate-binding protein [Mesorhizobium tianshanense]
MLRIRVIGCLAAIGFALATQTMAEESLRVGITPTGIPFTFVDTATRQPTGAMVDLASAIAANVGMDVEFQVNAFPALIPALTTGKINLISASMFITDKRRQVIDFSTPVYAYGEAMFVAAGDAKNYSIEELAGEAVGAQIGSTYADALQGLGVFGQVKLYDSIADMMRDVVLGRIKAGFGDAPIIAYQLSKNPDLGVRLVDGYQPMKRGEVALAVAKENPLLLERVNASIAKLKENGELTRIFSRYGL